MNNGWITHKKAAGPTDIPYDRFDRDMLEHMNRVGADTASLSIVFNNVLIATKDYGNAPSNVRYRDASVQKAITATAIRRVINAGTGGLTLSTTVRTYLGLPAPLDSRCDSITVQHLLDHKGGWDLRISGDPHFQNRKAADALGVASPPTQRQLAEYALTKVWLDYAPGTVESYSNVGYTILAECVEQATGQSFLTYIKSMMALVGAEATGGLNQTQDPREPLYQSHGLDPYMVPSVYAEGLVGYRGGTSGSSAASATLNTTRFSEVIPGDLMIATVRASAGAQIQAPGDWTRGADLGLANEGWWYKFVDPDTTTEPTSYNWSDGLGGTPTWSWAIDILGGVSQTAPFDATSTAMQGTTSATPAWVSLTTVTAKAWSYLISIDRNNGSDLPLPANYTQRIAQTGTPGSLRTSTREITVAGAVAPTTTDSAPRDHALYSIALKPAPSVKVPFPYGGFAIENMYGGGGMVYSTIDLAKYLVGLYDGVFPQPESGAIPPQSAPYSWMWLGSMPGTWAMMWRKFDGTNYRACAASFNSRSDTTADDDLVAIMEATLDTMV